VAALAARVDSLAVADRAVLDRAAALMEALAAGHVAGHRSP
jgi:hypothetical protein